MSLDNGPLCIDNQELPLLPAMGTHRIDDHADTLRNELARHRHYMGHQQQSWLHSNWVVNTWVLGVVNLRIP